MKPKYEDGNASVCVCLSTWCVCTSNFSCLLAAGLSDTKPRPLGWYKEANFVGGPSARRRASVWVSSLGRPVVVPEPQNRDTKDPELLPWSHGLSALSYPLFPYPASLTF